MNISETKHSGGRKTHINCLAEGNVIIIIITIIICSQWTLWPHPIFKCQWYECWEIRICGHLHNYPHHSTQPVLKKECLHAWNSICTCYWRLNPATRHLQHIIAASTKCLVRHQSPFSLNAEIEVTACDVIRCLSAPPRWKSGLISR